LIVGKLKLETWIRTRIESYRIWREFHTVIFNAAFRAQVASHNSQFAPAGKVPREFISPTYLPAGVATRSSHGLRSQWEIWASKKSRGIDGYT